MRVNNEVIVAVMIEVILVMIAEIMVSCIKENPFLCFSTLYHTKLDFSRRYKMKLYKIKLTDKFSGVRLVTVTAKTAGEVMDLVDRSEGENIAVIEELV